MKKLLSVLLIAVLLSTSLSSFAMMDKNTMMDKKEMMQDKKVDMMDTNMTSSYVEYKVGVIGKLVKSGKTVVLFFHADRCPTCVSLDKDIKNNLKTIPNDVVIIKANYDTTKNLKKLYKVKSQNSLVVINKKGKIAARSKGSITTLKDLLKLVK